MAGECEFESVPDEVDRALAMAERSASMNGGFASKSDLEALQKAVLVQGLQPTAEMSGQHITQRGRVWKQLLGVGPVRKDLYVQLVEKGEHPVLGSKIRNDTFRTFKNCSAFENSVPEERMIRLLNAFVHACEERNFTYVQGMNVICGMLLYVMPELDAFFCFLVLVCNHLPNYMRKNLEGVTTGCELVGECIRRLDPELSAFMETELEADARVYAFAPVLTLGACCPPIDSIVELWDIYFAAGVHLNIVFYASQLVLMREEILGYRRENSHRNGTSTVNWKQCLRGRDFPLVDATVLARVAFPFLLRLDDCFMDRLVQHLKPSSL